MKPPIRNKVLTDRYVPRTDFKREHYYFHRIDPRPDIPFDDAVNEAESSWLGLSCWCTCLVGWRCDMSHEYKNLCIKCGEHVLRKRWVLGYNTCMSCGEEAARVERKGWCVVPYTNKGAYMLMTNIEDLKTINPKRQGY